MSVKRMVRKMMMLLTMRKRGTAGAGEMKRDYGDVRGEGRWAWLGEEDERED